MSAAEPGPEIWFIRCEGGTVEPMALPLGEGMGSRLASGALVRVNEDGSLWTGEPGPAEPDEPGEPGEGSEKRDVAEKPEEPVTLAAQNAVKELAEAAELTPLPRPADAARKPEWIRFAVSTGRITQAAAEDLTKDELVRRFGG